MATSHTESEDGGKIESQRREKTLQRAKVNAQIKVTTNNSSAIDLGST